MAFDNPPALAAAAVPAVLLLVALIRPRRRDIAVGSLLLWRRALARAGAARQPVESVPLSLLLCLAGLLALASAWAGPKIERGDPARRVRVVLDRSAVMRSLRADGAERWAEARRRCAAFLRGLSDRDEVDLLVVPDADLSRVPAGTAGELAGWVEALSAADIDTDWTIEWCARAGPPRPTVVFSARPATGPADESVTVDLVGGRPDNLAAVRLADLALPDGRRQIYVEVRNTGTVSASAEVRLSADGARLNGADRAAPAAGETARVHWTGRLPAGAKTLRAELLLDDALAADNVAELTMRPAAKVRVALVGTEEPMLVRLLKAHPRAERAATPAEADLVVANGVEAPADFRGPVINIGAVQPGDLPTGPAVEDRVLRRFAPDRDSVFRHADLADLPIRKLTPLRPQKTLAQRPVAWTDAGEVAAAEWESSGRRRVALGFSCAAENFGLSGDWPAGLKVFWGRLLDSFAEPPAEPPPPSRPLAAEDRPLPADMVAALPAAAEAPPLSLQPVLVGLASALLGAGWWAAGRAAAP